MPALYIILGILLFLFLLTLFNIYVYVIYDNELFLSVKVAFIKIKILPPEEKKKKAEKKPKKEKKKKKKKKSDEKPEKKKPNKLTAYFKQKGVSGIVNIVKRISKLAVGVLKDLFKKITIEKLKIEIKIAGETAEDTAVRYGEVCSVFFPALRLITQIVKVKIYDVNVNPDFTDGAKSDAKADVVAKIRILSLLKIAFSRAFEVLRLYLKARPKKIKKAKNHR